MIARPLGSFVWFGFLRALTIDGTAVEDVTASYGSPSEALKFRVAGEAVRGPYVRERSGWATLRGERFWVAFSSDGQEIRPHLLPREPHHGARSRLHVHGLLRIEEAAGAVELNTGANGGGEKHDRRERHHRGADEGG